MRFNQSEDKNLCASYITYIVDINWDNQVTYLEQPMKNLLFPPPPICLQKYEKITVLHQFLKTLGLKNDAMPNGSIFVLGQFWLLCKFYLKFSHLPPPHLASSTNSDWKFKGVPPPQKFREKPCWWYIGPSPFNDSAGLWRWDTRVPVTTGRMSNHRKTLKGNCMRSTAGCSTCYFEVRYMLVWI